MPHEPCAGRRSLASVQTLPLHEALQADEDLAYADHTPTVSLTEYLMVPEWCPVTYAELRYVSGVF